MAILTRVEPTIDGTDPGFVAADVAGDSFAVDDDTTLWVDNASASPVDVTLTSQATAEPGIAPANKVVTVPAGAVRAVRCNPSGRFRDANGRANVTYSAVASVTVAVTRTA